ncbi:hypothetical protein FHS85_000859 [Rhodoligotrophos appendicifer]|uniref:sulfite exporter TauE/SafE family protein n=1 Tax=Rhodoligotrophos appendicifer TaxID=987056 RepID=UPI00117BE863|nr:sulfite exporter TauE/SafE family protein [Rhodoligotrophos appendicifer]
MAFSYTELAIIGLSFVAGGFVKGVSGMGLPLLVVPILLQFYPLRQAIAMMIVPVVVTNVTQMLNWSEVKAVSKRFKTLLICLPIGISIGSLALFFLDPHQLDLAAGLLILGFALFGLIRVEPRTLKPNEKLWNPIVGMIIGILGGFSSLYGPPTAFYLLALRVDREFFIIASALIFFVAGMMLNVIIIANGLVTWDDIALSTFGLLPVALGLLLGRFARRLVSQATFNKIILWFLLLVGVNQLMRGAGVW